MSLTTALINQDITILSHRSHLSAKEAIGDPRMGLLQVSKTKPNLFLEINAISMDFLQRP